MNIRVLSFLSLCALLITCIAGQAIADSPKTNLMLIIADDCTYRDLEVYGGQAKSPHLNKLASEGIKFTRCFQAAPMCSPTRHCLYTGLYPVKSGAYPNHTMAYDWVKSIVHLLEPANYRSYLSGKTHVNPKPVFPFEYSTREKDGNPDPMALEKAIQRSETSKTPFLFIAASHEPHAPWNKGDASAYPPASLRLPPVMVDSPDTRDAFSKYLAEITYFDAQVGELLAVLDKNGQRDNTLVIVISEQGNSFPFAKWTCYDVGLASGCIARWPVHVKADTTSDALIEYVDFVPTFLDVAGIPTPANLDGKSFVKVLEGQADQHKSHVFGLQTTRGIQNGSEYFGIRSVRDSRYRYIRNLTPEVTFQNAATKEPTFKTWERMASDGNANAERLVHDYLHRVAEELYDCEADPWNRTNLIADEKLATVRNDLRGKMDAWMTQQGDEGQATEMKALERMPKTANREDEPKKGKKKAKKVSDL